MKRHEFDDLFTLALTTFSVAQIVIWILLGLLLNNEWNGHVARMGEKRNVYKILVGKPEGKRPLGRARHRWVDNIKMDLREIGWDGMDWIDLVQDRHQRRALMNTVVSLRVSIKCWEVLE
jgi:hypothetical protein